MNPTLLSEKDLKEWAGRCHKAALEEWLRVNRIPFLYNGKGEIVTTERAITSALLGARTTLANPDDIQFE